MLHRVLDSFITCFGNFFFSVLGVAISVFALFFWGVLGLGFLGFWVLGLGCGWGGWVVWGIGSAGMEVRVWVMRWWWGGERYQQG